MSSNRNCMGQSLLQKSITKEKNKNKKDLLFIKVLIFPKKSFLPRQTTRNITTPTNTKSMHIHDMVIYDDEIHLSKESNSVNAKQSVLQMTTVPVYLSTVSFLANNNSINKKAISLNVLLYSK